MLSNHYEDKDKQLEQYRKQNTEQSRQMTNDSGAKQSNDERTLKAGRRGPLVMHDTHFYRKQSHFNRERIPEKVVHARGFGVYGEFETYKSLSHITVADFLQKPGKVTDTFVRFSNFVGSKGSKDTAVDVRGFATKFYTEEGNYDMLGLQFPAFLVQDATKFADMVHSIKPEPQTETPQATGAHDTFWDYIANNQETAHMIMWLMSMRGRPRSWRMMEGYPINTFRFVNKEGKSTFVRFVWKPLLGVHGLLLEEANILGGVDPDYHRNDVIEAIRNGKYPEYELGIQLINEEDEFKYDFDVLDDTKLWPEEDVPVEIIGKMTLNRLVDNFFAEEEQSSFDPSTLVPGIDFSNDPVLQGRTFAYRDTDYHRLGSSNINEIPVNKPIAETNFNHRDGRMRQKIDVDNVAYHNNSLADNTPETVPGEDGGFVDYPEQVEGYKTRDNPSNSFEDHFSQARLFWNSLTSTEQRDAIESFSFHLGKVESKSVRQQNAEMWANVDTEMAKEIAKNIGVKPSETSHIDVDRSLSSISMQNSIFEATTQKVGVLIGDNFNEKEVISVLDKLKSESVFVDIISDRLGTVTGDNGKELEVDKTFLTSHPTLLDSLYIVGGKADNQEKFDKQIYVYCTIAFEHYKPIGLSVTGNGYLSAKDQSKNGIITAENNSNFADDFLSAIATQRFWNR